MTSGERGLAEATAQCNLFKISYSIPPCLSETMEAAFMALPAWPSETQLNNFIDTYGTHALKQVNMGAKFVATASYSKDAYQSYEHEGRTIKFGGEVSAWMVTVKGSMSSSSSTTE